MAELLDVKALGSAASVIEGSQVVGRMSPLRSVDNSTNLFLLLIGFKVLHTGHGAVIYG